MFDNVCKFLAEHFSQDFASWLLGEPISFTTLSPTELSLEPIRADTLILLQAQNLILHLEFQTRPDPEMSFRAIDYRVRLYRRFPKKRVRQIVIYLLPTDSRLVYETAFAIAGTRHEYEVIRLWEQSPVVFQEYVGLLPFAVLGQTGDREEILRDVAARIEEIEDRGVQSNVAAATALLGGLVLERGIIQRLLRSDIMKESVVYQDIKAEGIAQGKAEGIAEGEQKGLQKGLQKGQAAMLVRLLTRKLGPLDPKLVARIARLSSARLEKLALAVFDLSTIADLENWLQSRK